MVGLLPMIRQHGQARWPRSQVGVFSTICNIVIDCQTTNLLASAAAIVVASLIEPVACGIETGFRPWHLAETENGEILCSVKQRSPGVVIQTIALELYTLNNSLMEIASGETN